MNVALVHMRHAHSGGTERYLDHLAGFLARRGHRVTIVCRSHAEPPHPAVRFVRLRPPSIGAAWRLVSFGAAVERHVRASGYELVYGLGRTWTHDVVRLGGGCHATYLERLHGTGAGLRLAGLRPKHRAILAAERRALAPGAYARIVVNSELVRRDVLERFRAPPGDVRVVHNGVDVQRFHPRQRAAGGAELRRSLGLEPGDYVVLFLGNGYERKGLDLVLAACAELARALPGARLVVAGNDSREGHYRRLAERLGISGATRFLGARRDAELVYAAADLYALPTRYDPFANSTLEALASGLPVVTSAANGGAELIQSGQEGEVLRAPDAAGLAAALRAWADPERRRAGALAARALAERHPIEAKLEQSLELLEEVRAARPAARAAAHSPA
jgi:UDP-glucose:(heptosyl)LPS alpha-1,3-glucosyltransferase